MVKNNSTNNGKPNFLNHLPLVSFLNFIPNLFSACYIIRSGSKNPYKI